MTHGALYSFTEPLVMLTFETNTAAVVVARAPSLCKLLCSESIAEFDKWPLGGAVILGVLMNYGPLLSGAPYDRNKREERERTLRSNGYYFLRGAELHKMPGRKSDQLLWGPDVQFRFEYKARLRSSKFRIAVQRPGKATFATRWLSVETMSLSAYQYIESSYDQTRKSGA